MQLNGAKIRDYYRLGSDMNTEDESFVTFKIPHFQRPFTWTSTQISALIKDHAENENPEKLLSPYFAGAIVTAVEGDCHSLIDGQQRYTTLFLANYIRFLLYRSYFAVAIDRRDYKARELASHFEKVTRYIFAEQDFVKSDMLKEYIDEVMTDPDSCKKNKTEYLKQVFLPTLSIDHASYQDTHRMLIFDKLSKSNLLLSYDRNTFNEQLRQALS